MMTKRTFDLIVDVIAMYSRRDSRFRTPKQIVVFGLELLFDANLTDQCLALKTFDWDEHRGSIPHFFQFEGAEKQLMRTTQAQLQEHTGIKVSSPEIILLAVLAAARAGAIKPLATK